MDLSDEDREKIQAEEIFRSEVRRKLASGQERSLGKRLIAFLNTGLGLWLLSTVAVGSISLAYAALQSHLAVAAEQRVRLERTETEVVGRLLQWQKILSHPSLKSEIKTPEDFAIFHEMLMSAPSTQSAGIRVHAIFPEFQTTPTIALLFELGKLKKSRGPADDIDKFVDEVITWNPLAESGKSAEELIAMLKTRVEGFIH